MERRQFPDDGFRLVEVPFRADDELQYVPFRKRRRPRHPHRAGHPARRRLPVHRVEHVRPPGRYVGGAVRLDVGLDTVPVERLQQFPDSPVDQRLAARHRGAGDAVGERPADDLLHGDFRVVVPLDGVERVAIGAAEVAAVQADEHARRPRADSLALDAHENLVESHPFLFLISPAGSRPIPGRAFRPSSPMPRP